MANLAIPNDHRRFGGPDPAIEWRYDSDLDLGDKPGNDPYGYRWDGALLGTTFEGLVQQLLSAPAIPAVWTPETEGLARPEAVPELATPLAALRIREAARGIVVPAVLFTASAAVLAYVHATYPEFQRLALVWAGFMLLWLGGAVWDWREARKRKPTDFAQARQNYRHQVWLAKQPVLFTYGLVAAVAAAGIVGMFMDDTAIAAAGLVKDAVWRGETWRLLTGPMLHVNAYHLWANATGLLALGRIMETHAPRAHLPVVFLASALAGSVLSLLLLSTSSVGASGGLMGMVGYLTVLAYRRPTGLPGDFWHRMRTIIAATAVFGAVLFFLIDNAAHFGGLVAGALVGLAFLPKKGEPRWTGIAAWVVAWICAAIAVAGAAAVVGLTTGA